MFGWDRNPLRRRIDRVEAAALAGLIVVFLVAVPLLVLAVGQWARTAGLRTLRTEAAWSQVPATVQRAAPGQSDSSPGPEGTVWMQAHWTAPDGRPRHGWIAVSPDVTTGRITRIWVSRAGTPTGTPPGRSEQLGWTPIAEVGTVPVLALLFVLTACAGRRLFAWRRLDDWHRAWRSEGPP